MKIVLEDSDIAEIIKSHVKSTNLLGLADKEFTVIVDYDEANEEVTAAIDTAAVATTGPAEEKPKQKRKRRSKAAIEAAEAEAKSDETPKAELSVVEATEDTSEPEEELTAAKEVDEAPKNSLFG